MWIRLFYFYYRYAIWGDNWGDMILSVTLVSFKRVGQWDQIKQQTLKQRWVENLKLEMV